ncbi:hypothetical protein ADK76_07040 [Streptomyces griseoflavus]|nr:hypothetical protein ADK76_07040 [Streptomyces griseoflavus]
MDRPKAMLNIRHRTVRSVMWVTAMSPVSQGAWPSWKRWTTVPRVAARVRVLSSRALRGSSRLRVRRSRTRKTVAAMVARTVGRRLTMASVVSASHGRPVPPPPHIRPAAFATREPKGLGKPGAAAMRDECSCPPSTHTTAPTRPPRPRPAPVTRPATAAAGSASEEPGAAPLHPGR